MAALYACDITVPILKIIEFSLDMLLAVSFLLPYPVPILATQLHFNRLAIIISVNEKFLVSYPTVSSFSMRWE